MLGNIIDSKIQVNKYGRIAGESWQWLADRYAYVVLDEWVIMPNHLHGIIFLETHYHRGGSRTAPTEKYKTIGRLVGAFKIVSTKRINDLRQKSGIPVWQRNFYEHIIRNEDSLNKIREYIATNPERWEMDRENPQVKGEDEFDRWLASFYKDGACQAL